MGALDVSAATGQTCTPAKVITVSNSYDANATANAATGAIYAKIDSGECQVVPDTSYGATWPLVQAAAAHGTLSPVVAGAVTATLGTVELGGSEPFTVG